MRAGYSNPRTSCSSVLGCEIMRGLDMKTALARSVAFLIFVLACSPNGFSGTMGNGAAQRAAAYGNGQNTTPAPAQNAAAAKPQSAAQAPGQNATVIPG